MPLDRLARILLAAKLDERLPVRPRLEREFAPRLQAVPCVLALHCNLREALCFERTSGLSEARER